MQAYKILWANDQSTKAHYRLFTLLSESNAWEVSGLLFSNEYNPRCRYQQSNERATSIRQADNFFYQIFSPKKIVLQKVFPWAKYNEELYPIDPLLNEVIWRNFLSEQLTATDRIIIKDKAFYFTAMSAKQRTNLKTDAFEFVIFSKLTPIRVAKNSKVLIYMTDPLAETSEKLCEYAKQFNFVCASEMIANQLTTIAPEIKKTLHVIPEDLSKEETLTAWQTLFNKLQLEHT